MNAAAQGIRCLGVDRSEPDQAAERRLNVATWTAEAIIKVEVAKCRVQVIAPHQHNHTAAEPNAFRVSRRTVDDARGFGEFVGFALAVFGGISRICCGRLVLILGTKIAALRDRATDAEQQREAGNGKATQKRLVESEQHSTHKVPRLLLAATTWPRPPPVSRCQMPLKLVPNAAETPLVVRSNIRIPFQRAFLRMLESKDHKQI
jgi:hypothetical protein